MTTDTDALPLPPLRRSCLDCGTPMVAVGPRRRCAACKVKRDKEGQRARYRKLQTERWERSTLRPDEPRSL